MKGIRELKRMKPECTIDRREEAYRVKIEENDSHKVMETNGFRVEDGDPMDEDQVFFDKL